MLKDTKQCPYCGEEILAVAKKCRYCGEWLKQETPQKPKTISCPYCGEEILATAIKCEHCGEILTNYHYYETMDSDNFIICKIAKMQEVSNVLWKVFSIIMLIAGVVFLAYSGDKYFQQGAEMSEMLCIGQGIGLLILGIYNLVNLPTELPDKIRKSSYYVIEYYEDITKFIVALIINLILSYLGVFLIILDLCIRHKVMKNVNLFNKSPNR